MTKRPLSLICGALLLTCSGCVVAPAPPPVAAGGPYGYPSYGYYPYAPSYGFPWLVAPEVSIGIGRGWGGWDGWGRGWGRR